MHPHGVARAVDVAAGDGANVGGLRRRAGAGDRLLALAARMRLPMSIDFDAESEDYTYSTGWCGLLEFHCSQPHIARSAGGGGGGSRL